MGFGPKIQEHYSQRKYDIDGCAALRMVCGITDTTFEDGSVIEKDLNLSRGIGDGNEVVRDPYTRSRVGSSTNLHATSKLEFINAKLEARKSISTRGTYGGKLY